MARRNTSLLGGSLLSGALFPAAIGVIGVIYYAMEAHAPKPLPGSPDYKARAASWTRHVQTGQLMAVAALATGVLITRMKSKK